MKIEYLIYYKHKDKKVTKNDSYIVSKEAFDEVFKAIEETGRPCDVKVNTVIMRNDIESPVVMTLVGEHIRRIEKIIYPANEIVENINSESTTSYENTEINVNNYVAETQDITDEGSEQEQVVQDNGQITHQW